MNDDMAGRIMAHAFHDELEKIAGIRDILSKFTRTAPKADDAATAAWRAKLRGSGSGPDLQNGTYSRFQQGHPSKKPAQGPEPWSDKGISKEKTRKTQEAARRAEEANQADPDLVKNKRWGWQPKKTHLLSNL